MTSPKAPRGTDDLYPPDSELLSEIEGRARELFDRYGYRRLDTPLFEHTDVFLRSIGESSDVVVQKQMYTFLDPGERSLTLRPEATAGVVRAFVEHRLDQKLPGPVRLWTIGPMFRYERPQKGRSRQFLQLNLECIGSASPLVDAELVQLGAELFSGLGLGPHVLINSMGCPADRERYAGVLREELAEHESSLCEDCLERMRTNPLRVFDCKVPDCRTIVREEVAPVAEFLCDGCRAHFEAVTAALDATGVVWKQAPDLVRGFDYYTGTVWEYDLPDLGARSAVGGGGRYDGLVEELGGPDLPGVGMAVGVDPLMVALKETREARAWRPDAYVAWLDEGLSAKAYAIASQLRESGLRVLVSDEAKSLRAQLRAADRSQAARAVILGPDEAEREVATIRDLASGDQDEVPLAELSGRLSGA